MRITDKAPRRAEIERLVTEYFANGGEIHHNANTIPLVCTGCHYRKTVRAMVCGRTVTAGNCPRCQSRMRIG